MKQYLAFDECVAQYEDDELFPTEWEGYPLYHTDPFWNAALFDEPQRQDFRAADLIFMVSGDWASDGVRLLASKTVEGMLLEIKDDSGYLPIWLEPATLKAFRDFINTTK